MTQQADKPIDQWLELVEKARNTLTKAKYQEWQFIVGSSGTLEERIKLGERAIKIVRPATKPDIIFNIKPFEHPYPMQEGRKPKR